VESLLLFSFFNLEEELGWLMRKERRKKEKEEAENFSICTGRK